MKNLVWVTTTIGLMLSTSVAVHAQSVAGFVNAFNIANAANRKGSTEVPAQRGVASKTDYTREFIREFRVGNYYDVTKARIIELPPSAGAATSDEPDKPWLRIELVSQARRKPTAREQADGLLVAHCTSIDSPGPDYTLSAADAANAATPIPALTCTNRAMPLRATLYKAVPGSTYVDAKGRVIAHSESGYYLEYHGKYRSLIPLEL